MNAVVKPKSGDPIPSYAFDDTDGTREREEERGGLLDWVDIFRSGDGTEVDVEENDVSEGSHLEEVEEGTPAAKKQRMM